MVERIHRVHFKVNGQIVQTIEVPVERPFSGRVSVNSAPGVPKKVCPYLGPIVKHVKNELCGCKGRFESVHTCTHFNDHATTTQYKHNQPERCCIGCPVGPFSADF